MPLGNRLLTVKLSVPGTSGLSNNVALTATQDEYVIPVNGYVIQVQCVGKGKNGTTDPTMDVYLNGATILTGVMTIAANDTVYTGTLKTNVAATQQPTSGTKVVKGDILTMRCFTHNTSGQLITPSITLLIKY